MITLATHGKTVTLDLPEDDHITKVFERNQDWYEKAMLEDIYARGLSGTAIDVGACFGTHSTFFAAVCSLNVIAIEPRSDNFNVLKNNIALNHLEDKIQAVPFAVGAKKGFVTLTQALAGNRGSTTAEIAGHGIPMITLDDLDLNNLALIKIDVEGMEVDVIQGARKQIEAYRPMIYVESVATYAAMSRLMESLKYRQIGKWNATPTYGWMPK